MNMQNKQKECNVQRNKQYIYYVSEINKTPYLFRYFAKCLPTFRILSVLDSAVN